MTYTIWIQDPLLWLPFGLFVFILFLFLFQLALFLRVERYSQMFLLVTQGWGQESLSITANLISLLDEKHLHFHCIFIKLIREDVAIYSLNKKSFFIFLKCFIFSDILKTASVLTWESVRLSLRARSNTLNMSSWNRSIRM